MFFTPVVVAFVIMELLVLNLPINYKYYGQQLNSHSQEIELMGLGSSQMKCAFNPDFADVDAINLSSTSQHHKEDFHILKGTRKRLPNLKFLLLEVSFNHLELPHHPDDYWKNSVYLKYYDVNAFNRSIWFKDRLLILSNNRFYSRKLLEHYFFNSSTEKFNSYGFDTNNFYGTFKELDYDTSKINTNNFRIISREDLSIFKKNTDFLYEMLEYAKAENINVILCTLPLYKTYLKKRNPSVVRRRDSVLQMVQKQYSNVILLNRETDTIHFNEKDFLNENHLNPNGAKKFTALLNQKINGFD
ncbi:hypothetical protein QRD02_05795 [Aequorivita sp. SDUM287046]|uniref:SGNH/GDSL hydrolase family protein n=1 Tax=Aequorivita aurantiaca TaxID=3053356 RepID=A0ABT8DEY7_9FLAO|nr:hypothetical protein [Aequorivita aurantiaca]MDN3723886.1 hypothetical protein [Aequorivita aurantiaca]